MTECEYHLETPESRFCVVCNEELITEEELSRLADLLIRAGGRMYQGDVLISCEGYDNGNLTEDEFRYLRENSLI